MTAGSVNELDLKGERLKMSVIGRLDSQVEEVIIAPIARRHERQNKEREEAKQKPPEEALQRETEESPRDSE